MEMSEDGIFEYDGRNMLRISTLHDPDINQVVPHLSRFLSSSSSTCGNLEKLDRDVYLSGNAVFVSKLKLSGGEEYHVKLVKAPDSESVYLQTVTARYPNLVNDGCVLLPTVVDAIDSVTGNVKYYIHVSRWQKSEGTLAELLVRLWMKRMHKQLDAALQAFGRFLRGFHSQYPKLMHNDMNPSNVLLVTSDGKTSFVLADCAGLDDEVGDDFDSFLKSLEVLAEGGFGSDFFERASEAFTCGYNQDFK